MVSETIIESLTSHSPEFVNYAIHWGYLGIFLWFVTVDQLTPIPEEITLLTIGYLAANNIFNPVLAAIVSLVAFLTVDVVYFFLAKSGHKLITNLYAKNTWTKKYAENLRTNMGKTLMILCFIPRMRMFGPILVGMLNLSFMKFLIFDTLSLLGFSILYISIGEIFHRSLYALLQELDQLRHLIFAAMILLTGFFLVRSIIRRKRESRAR